MRNDAQVMFQVADVYRLIEDGGAAVDWLQQALSGTVKKTTLNGKLYLLVKMNNMGRRFM